MASVPRKLEALREEARERDLTPVEWWIGEAHHDDVKAALAETDHAELEAERLARIDGLPVKVLTETPDRFALWCEEGALDL